VLVLSLSVIFLAGLFAFIRHFLNEMIEKYHSISPRAAPIKTSEELTILKRNQT
jgi:hypothetical protein